MLFDCLKKAPVKVSKPVDKEGKTPLLYRSIAIVIGHNAKASGADNYKGESEFSYNSRIARKLVDRMNKINPVNKYIIVERPAVRSYNMQVKAVEKQCVKHGVREAYCLHFNDASSSSANGLEILHTILLSMEQKLRAKKIAYDLAEMSGSVLRGNEGLKKIKSGHGGYKMMYTLETNYIDTILLEPCFAKDRNAGYFFFEEEDKYVELLAKGILG